MLAVVAGISLMVWNVAHAEGLVVESLSVPPDLAARGLTGEVVAGQMLDKLRASLDPGVNVNFVSRASPAPPSLISRRGKAELARMFYRGNGA